MKRSTQTFVGLLVGLGLFLIGCDGVSSVEPEHVNESAASKGMQARPSAGSMNGSSCGPACGSIYGIQETSGEIFKIQLNDLSAASMFSPVIADPVAYYGPNGLALNLAEDRLYFSNFEAGSGDDPLYYIDLGTGDQVSAGDLDVTFNATATFAGGSYFFTPQVSNDDLVEVTFNPDGTIASKNVACGNFTDGSATTTNSLIYGDYAVRQGEDLIYGNARFGSDDQATFFTLHRLTCTFDVIDPSTTQLQLAFDAAGNLIGHHGTTGEFFVVDPETGALESLGTVESAGQVLSFNDLAPGRCTAVEDCITIELLDATTNPDGTRTFQYQVTSNCNRGLSFIAFELPDDVIALNPVTTAPLGKIENPGGTRGPVNPRYHNLKFELAGDFKEGDMATFSYSLPLGAEYNGEVQIRTKYARSITDLALTADICPIIDN